MKKYTRLAYFSLSVLTLLTLWTFFSNLIEKGEYKKEQQILKFANECYKNNQEFIVERNEEAKFIMRCEVPVYYYE